MEDINVKTQDLSRYQTDEDADLVLKYIHSAVCMIVNCIENKWKNDPSTTKAHSRKKYIDTTSI